MDSDTRAVEQHSERGAQVSGVVRVVPNALAKVKGRPIEHGVAD